MENETMTSEEWDEQVGGLPVSAVLGAERKNRYGSVPGLDDEELADPDELERQIVREAFAPILTLPRRGRQAGFQANMDEGGEVDWGAFGTVDFERTYGVKDKSRAAEAGLREQLGGVSILMSIVHHRFRVRAKYRVLRYVRAGIIGLDHIVHDDMRALAMLDARCRKLSSEIRELREHRERRERRAVPLLAEAV